jgi:hypothetical protein
MRHHDGRSVLDARKNGQITGSDVVRDRWNAGGTAQPTYGFPGNLPSAIVHAVPEFIWGMSDNESLMVNFPKRHYRFIAEILKKGRAAGWGKMQTEV